MSPSVDPVLSVFKVPQNQRHSQPLTMLSRGVDLHEKWVSGQNGGEMPWVSCRGAKHAQGWPSEGETLSYSSLTIRNCFFHTCFPFDVPAWCSRPITTADYLTSLAFSMSRAMLSSTSGRLATYLTPHLEVQLAPSFEPPRAKSRDALPAAQHHRSSPCSRWQLCGTPSKRGSRSGRQPTQFRRLRQVGG